MATTSPVPPLSPGPPPTTAVDRPAHQSVAVRTEPLDLRDLLAHWRLVLGTALLVGAIAAVVVIARDRTYTSHASFIPQQRTPQGNIGSLAAQFGVSLQTSPPGQSPQFYADLITTRDLFVALLDSPYVAGSSRRINLADVIGAKGGTADLKRDDALRRLRLLIDGSVNQKTGVVSLSVKMPDATLAALVAERVLKQLNRFNLEIRQSQAAAERKFTEQQQQAALAELRQSEDRLRAFLDENRSWEGSPQLVFTHGRLNSDVELRRQTYASLTQAYEQAKIEEVRDTPVITVIESPQAPSRPDPRGLVSTTASAALAGGMLGLLLVWMRRRLKEQQLFSRTVDV